MLVCDSKERLCGVVTFGYSYQASCSGFFHDLLGQNGFVFLKIHAPVGPSSAAVVLLRSCRRALVALEVCDFGASAKM